MQLTIAAVNTTRTYHFEASEKYYSLNTEHLGFDTLQMAAIPKMHFDSLECDITCQRTMEGPKRFIKNISIRIRIWKINQSLSNGLESTRGLAN